MKLILLTLSLIAMNLKSEPTVQYTVSMPDPSKHIFYIGISFNSLNTGEDYFDIVMPAWRPGRYLIFDFSGSVIEFNAPGYNWKKIDKSTWRIFKGNSGSVSIEYKLYANEFNLRTKGLNEEHAFINGAAVFMYSEKLRNLPLILKIEPYSEWHITTGLDNFENNKNIFYAPDYDYLADCPLEIGTQQDFEFDAEGKKHVISIFGKANYNKDTLIRDFTKIILKNYSFWKTIPYEKYIIIVHCTPESSGGTEHINSTVVGCTPQQFESDILYENFLRLISHEFFHTWNVKQLRPKGITPYDYTKENYLEELWIAEGSTSYYDGLMIERTRQYPLESFNKEIESSVRIDRLRPGNKVQSLAESSFDAWVKFWKGNPWRGDYETDYYARGSHVSMILDLDLRQKTNNSVSLDDVFRTMLVRFPLGTGYANSDFQAVCEELSRVNYDDFFKRYIYGTDDIDWEKYLFYAGLELKKSESTVIPVLGIHIMDKTGKILIDSIESGSIGETTGLKKGDQLIAFENNVLSFQEALNKFDTLKTGAMSLSIIREKELREFRLRIPKKDIKYTVKKISEPNELQKKIYESWLERKWEE